MSPGLVQELTRALAVGGLFLAFMAIAELWQRRLHPPVEWTRKFVHVAGGLVSLAFPWLFTSVWTVVGLGAAMAALLAITRQLGWLRSVHGVERPSHGDLYFPVAVVLLFVLARDRPVFYAISLFCLVVADALAAL